MLKNVAEINAPDLVNTVAAFAPQGYRFVTLTCCDLGDAFEILYHFDKDYELRHLRLRLSHGATLPSVSSVFPAAALVENEIRELFGVAVSGLALDYSGRFMLAENAPAAPFRKQPTPAPTANAPAGEAKKNG